MARKINNLAEVKVYINGKEQAKRDLEELTKKAEELNKEVDALKNKELRLSKEPEKVGEYNEARKERLKKENEYKKLQRVVRETKKFTEDIEEDLNNLSGQSLARLKVIERSLMAIRQRLDPNEDKDGDFLAFLNENLQRVTETIKQKKGEIIEFSDIMDDLTNIDDTSLIKAEQRLKSLLAATDKDDIERIKQLRSELKQVQDEGKRRVKLEAVAVQQQVSDGTYKGTIEETQRAIKLQEEYKKSLKTTDSKAIKEVEKTIEGLNKKLDAYQKKQTASVLKNLDDNSYAQIQAAIEHAKKLQQAAKPGSSAWNNYGKQIANATLYLEKWNDQQKRTKMVEMSKMDLGKMSDDDLKTALRYWDGMVNGIGRTNVAMKQYKEIYDRLQAENTKRGEKLITKVVDQNDLGGNINQMQQRLQILEDFRKTIDSTKPDAYLRVDAAIEKLKQGIKETQANFISFDDALAKAQQVADGTFDGTLEDIEKIQKALKEGMTSELNILDDADLQKMKEAQRLMEETAKKQQELARIRLEEQAKLTQDQVEKGTYKGTIEETEKAIAIQKQYQKTLDTTDAAGLKKVEDTIEALQQKLKQAQSELLSYKDAMDEAEKISSGTWKGTIEELEKIKKSLEYYKKNKLKIGADDKDLKKVNEALYNIDKTAKGTAMSAKQIQNILDHLDSASVEELEIAAKNLQDQLHGATRNVGDYAKTASKLREVNSELKKAKKEWEGQENVIIKTTKRLAAYVAVYGGFNAIVGKMKEVIGLNLQLSDSLADVQKTTGLTGVELQELGRELGSIDTRTATTELYNLAAAAGQVGLKTQEDVLGFAKAANIISVALNELGAEGSATITKIATLTGDVARSGTEDALLKVGSAINELTANSAATAGPIADFISRIGGIASSSGIAIHEMAALGAATDASAQSIEIAGTSMNKFITALLSNTENIAYATNLNAQELQTLINNGETMQAVIRVLESMQTMDRGAVSGAMKELGSEGARMNQYIASMVSNLDMLKRQLAISREAFDENVSVLNEYNVKQESAMGILQRMKNAFLDTFVNSKMTVILKDVLQWVAALPRNLEKIPPLLIAIKIIIAEILVFKLPFLLHRLAAQLSGMYALLSGPVIAGIKSFRNTIAAAIISVEAAGKSTAGLTGKLRVLWAVIAANPIGIIVALVTAATAAWVHFKTQTNEVVKATADLTQKHTRQIEELNALRSAIEATNTSYAVKAAAMREINSLYSKYLGFELDELDTYEKKKAALDYINAKLKENQTLELASKQNEVYQDTFNKETEKNIEELTEGLMAIPEIGAKRLTEAMNVINEAVKNGAKTTEEVLSELEKHFNTSIELDDTEVMSGIFRGGIASEVINFFTDTALESLDEYVEKYAILQQQLAGTDEYFNKQKIENQIQSDEALAELEQAQKNKIEAITKAHEEKVAKLEAEGRALTEAEQIAHLQNLLKEQQQYLETAKKMRDRARENDKKFLSDQTNEETGEIDLGNMHAKYGTNGQGHIVSSRVNELNGIRKSMEEIRKLQDSTNKDLAEASIRLTEAQKQNNEELIQAEKAKIEEMKRLQDERNVELTQKEMEWNDKYLALQTWATSKAQQQWGETVENIGSRIRSLQIQIAGDPWGKAFDLKDWKQFPELIEGLKGASITSLVQGFEKLRDNTKLITQDVDAFNKMFDLKTPLKDLDEVNTQVYRWLSQIRGELKERGRNTTGAPIFTNAKEELDLVLKNLQTHFLKRQKEIREAYIQGSMTSEEMDRQLAENDRIFVNERIELRKLLLGENSNFMKELYPSLADTNLPKLRLDLEVLGDEVTAELRKDLEEDENAAREGAEKIRKSIEKELIAGDPFGTLRSNFRSSLDQMMLMSSQFERDMVRNLQLTNNGGIKYDPFDIMGLSEKEQQKRLDFLIELSGKSYTVDRDGLRKMFESHSEYYNWVANLDDEQMAVMLNKLQWFYDESLIKQSQYKERVLKGLESAYLQQDEKMDDIAKLRWKIDKATADRDSLVKQNKAYEEGSGPSGVTKQQYDSNIQEIEARNQAIKSLEEKLQEELDKVSKKKDSKRRENERKAKEDMEASISALDAYYNEMEAKIRERGLELNLTDEEVERQILENSIKRQEDMIQLRKKLLGDESTFDPFANEGYKGAITGNVFFGKDRNEETLKRQAEQIKAWGKALTDGMRNQIAKSNIEIQKEAQKLKETIQNILLDKQFVKKAVDEMRASFDQIDFINEDTNEKLNFLWGSTDETNRTQEAADARMRILMQYSEDVYSEEADAFKKRLLQDAAFGSTVAKMNEEEYAAFLVLLQQYHDKVISAEKQHADERKRIIDQQWNEEGYKNGYESAERTIGIAENNLNTMQNAGAIANEQEFFDQYQQLVLNRVALEQWAYEQKKELYKKNNATQEQFQQLDLDHAKTLQDFQQKLLDNYIARYQKMADITTSYGNIIGDGFGRMIAGEEDAGKQLIKNLLTETIQMASQFAQRLILQSTFGAQMESIRATQNAAQLSAAYATAMSEVGIEASKMAAIEAIAAGEITAQSMAQPDSIVTWGGAGAARAAVIIGLVAAATAAALALVNSLFPESKASETSNRRLSTGMLTYAEGNYPVLGNDGKVYDAKYEGAGMKTGIYGGGAHFGIFSEKQPEMIVDGKTTQKLILNYPYIYDAITTIAKNGRLVNAMPTFASGDYPAGMKQIAPIATMDVSTGSNEQMERTNAVLEQATSVIRELSKVLTSGQISANVDPYANRKATQRAEKFMKRRGID